MNKLTEKEVRKEFKEHLKIKFLQSVGPTQTEHFMNGVPILRLSHIKETMMTNKDIKDKLEKLELKVDKIQLTLDKLEAKLSKHIDFIDDTYEGLRNPINVAKRFLGR